MRQLSASNIISAISHLNRNVEYDYINPTNKGKIHISRVNPNGPIYIKRYNPSLTIEQAKKRNQARTLAEAKEVTVSIEMIQRYANAIEENKPANIDRILGASYNTRAALESLLAYTPEFYFCYPGRVYTDGGREKVEKGHKHLMWTPDNPHKEGIIIQCETDMIISEIPTKEIVYESLYIPDVLVDHTIDIDIQRRHAQIQIALYIIGKHLEYRTWIARNDQGITYQDKRLCELPGVVSSLNGENIIKAFDGAINAAMFIDCIWFQNGKLMPAVMEIEHTTGIKSGIDRMMNLRDQMPALLTRYVIVAPDEDREKVFEIGHMSMYQNMNIRYFSYSAVEELYWICVNRNIGRTVTDSFLDCFMERVCTN